MPVLFKKFLLEALSIAVSAGVALSPPPSGLETEAMWVAGLLVWTLLNLILRFIPDFVVLMMMSCMWVVLHIMPFQQAFESFTGTTVWLLVGALGIGTAVTKSGLLTRVALCTMKLCSPTFSGQVFAMLASGVVLSPFIPSTTAKVAVAGALATDVGERLGLEDRSWGMSGIWCAMYTSYSLMSPILMSASYFSYVILNLMPEHIRGDLTLVRWSVAMLPWGVVTFLGAFAAISILYKPKHKIEISREDINEMLHDLGPVTRDEIITIAVVGVICSLIGSFMIKTGEKASQRELLKSMRTGTYFAAALCAVLCIPLTWYVMKDVEGASWIGILISIFGRGGRQLDWHTHLHLLRPCRWLRHRLRHRVLYLRHLQAHPGPL